MIVEFIDLTARCGCACKVRYPQQMDLECSILGLLNCVAVFKKSKIFHRIPLVGARQSFHFPTTRRALSLSYLFSLASEQRTEVYTSTGTATRNTSESAEHQNGFELWRARANSRRRRQALFIVSVYTTHQHSNERADVLNSLNYALG